ncbi:hypothetical protein [Hydrotalea sp. AMD]|uniref:hypothetical protein n=1 Tax=Hydrotalea sp. AMD TaxID=2501297 RepID=UPI00257B2C59|nr:hypothetical protein [Hydrotalea sp. AMD]
MELQIGTMYWLTGPDETKFRQEVDHDKFVYRLCAWPLPSNKNKPIKFGVYVAPKQERK